MTTIIVIGVVLVVCLLSAGYLMSRMPGQSFSGSLPELTGFEHQISANLNRHVEMLAGTIGERNVWQYENLLRAADYIESQFQSYGLDVRSYPYEANGKQVRSLEAEVCGTGESQEIIIIGAHYDSLAGTVGANDNASGVAVLLELARIRGVEPSARTVRFVAFVNEEPPFFKSAKMGSYLYAKEVKQRGDRVAAMVSLETLGYYTDEPLTQSFPLPLLRYFYPQVGNFVAFVGSYQYSALLRKSLAAFRGNASFPSEGMVAPGWLVGVDWSDHWSFWKAGYPALMITDTALFRDPYYHTIRDTPEKINYPALARITSGLRDVIMALRR